VADGEVVAEGFEEVPLAVSLSPPPVVVRRMARAVAVVPSTARRVVRLGALRRWGAAGA
jgi:hypothetical protein